MKGIPVERALIYVMLLGVLPILFLTISFTNKLNSIKEVKESLILLQNESFLKDKRQALNIAVRECHREADHFYIDKYLETLVFLEPEIEALQSVLADKNAALEDGLKKRLEFLTGSGNSMSFAEGAVQKLPLFHETFETLTHPVEINGKDLQKILSRIEGLSIGEATPGVGRPQLMITEWKLDKKKSNEKNEVYLLNLKLLKREFL